MTPAISDCIAACKKCSHACHGVWASGLPEPCQELFGISREERSAQHGEKAAVINGAIHNPTRVGGRGADQPSNEFFYSTFTFSPKGLCGRA